MQAAWVLCLHGAGSASEHVKKRDFGDFSLYHVLEAHHPRTKTKEPPQKERFPARNKDACGYSSGSTSKMGLVPAAPAMRQVNVPIFS